MADEQKKLSEMTEEEKDALSAEELAALEEAEDEAEGDGEPGSERRNTLYSRFRDSNERAKAEKKERERVEAENADLLRRLAAAGTAKETKEEDPDPVAPTPPAAFDFAAARAKKRAFLKDGDFEKAAEIEESIDNANVALETYREKRDTWRDTMLERNVEKRVKESTGEVLSRAEKAERASIEAVVSEMCEEFPFLDAKNPNKDAEAIDAVIARRNRYIEQGLSAAAAIKKAATEVGKRFAEFHKDDGKGKGGKANGKGARAEEETARGAREAEKLPANTNKAGAKNLPRDGKGRIIVANLTDDQIRNLTPEQEEQISRDSRNKG